MVVDEVVQRFFAIKGDNVFFKGLDTGEDVGGVPHPLFDQWIGQSAAKYLSSDERKIAFDDELGTFVITRWNEMKRYPLKAYLFENKKYFDFGPLGEWERLETKNTPRE